MGKWDLSYNPFDRISLKSEHDFIPEQVVETRCITGFTGQFAWGFHPPGAIHNLIHGGQGCGKTTCLLAIKAAVSRALDSSVRAVFINQNITMPRDEVLLFGPSVQGKHPQGYFRDPKQSFFVFLDLPDDYDRERLHGTLRCIDGLMNYKNIHLYVAMTTDLKNKAFKLSTIMGKFAGYELQPMTWDETLSMIKKRISLSRADRVESIVPFTEDGLKALYNQSQGRPRILMSLASVILNKYVMSDVDIIGRDIIEAELRMPTYAMDIIKDRIPDVNTQDTLILLRRIIVEKYGGHIDSQRIIIDHMAQAHGWSNHTTRKRLSKLTEIGVLELKTQDDFWTKSYRIR